MNDSNIRRNLTPPRGELSIASFEQRLSDEIGETARFQIGPSRAHGQDIFIWCEKPLADPIYPPTLDLRVALVQAGCEDQVDLDGDEERTTMLDMVAYENTSAKDRTTLPPPPTVLYFTYQGLERLISTRPGRNAVRVLTVLEPVSITVDAASSWRLLIRIAGVDGYRLLLPTDERIV